MLSNTKIGSRIKECREYVKETQNDIAKVLSCSRQIVSYYENGKRMPNTTDLYLLSEHFGVSTDYLLGLSDVQTTNTDTKAICEATGLSEISVEFLKWCISDAAPFSLTTFLPAINFFIESQWNYRADNYRVETFELDAFPEIKNNSLYNLNLVELFSSYLFGDYQINDGLFKLGDSKLYVEGDGYSYAPYLVKQSDLIERFYLDKIEESLKTAKKEFFKRRYVK